MPTAYSLSLMGRAWPGSATAPMPRSIWPAPPPPQPAALSWSSATQVDVAAIAQLLAGGQADQALARVRTLQAAHSGVADLSLLVGDVLAARGDYAGAAEQYRQAANLAFTEPAALRLVDALQRSGQEDQAAAVTALFAQQNPASLAAQWLLAGQALGDGDYDDAVARYEAILARTGSADAALLGNLAWASSGAGEDERALAYARRAFALDPGNAASADTYGWMLVHGGRPAEGLALLLAAARHAPQQAWIAPQQVAAR